MSIQIDLMKTFPTDWLIHLHANECMHFFKKIEYNLISLSKQNTIIYPKTENIFKAFELTAFENIKVVIIGQDPYHGEGEANGLCFSVNAGVKIPPSLKNIYKEIQRDLCKATMTHGDLSNWAKQGVFLINVSLTVEANKANSHAKLGWHEFTDFIIKSLSDQKKGLVFLLWGKFAEKKKSLIDEKKHHLLISSHPSPLGVYKGFAGCSHFSKTNEILISQHESPIEW